MNDHYHLGSGSDEQARLLSQREIYQDTLEINFSEQDTVVEFGCGSGANLWIAQQVSSGSYIGIDMQETQIRAAQKLALEAGLDNTLFLCQNASSSGLESNYADAVFCRCVLIHQSNPSKILSEMIRVAKTDARIVINEPWDPVYRFGPDKENLMKCYQARTNFVYGNGKGSPDISANLDYLIDKSLVETVNFQPHIILVNSNNKERCSTLIKNIFGLTEPVLPDLIKQGLVTDEEADLARQESGSISKDTFISQIIWKFEGRIIK